MSVARLTLRRKKPSSLDQFEKEFALESLKSDRLRVSILIGAIASALAFVLILGPIFFDEFQRAFHGNFRQFLIAVYVVSGANVCYLRPSALSLVVSSENKKSHSLL